MLISIIGASLVGSVCALIGGALLLWREQFARKISLLLVSFAIGSLTAAAFLELIPEALHESEYGIIAPWILVGIFAMFLFEKMVHWYHVHGEDDIAHAHEGHVKDPASLTAAILFGDSVHNFLDGIAIALAWSVDSATGIATTIAVFFHEVPQEIGDFGVLIHLGYERAKVFWYNFVTALATPVGALLAYFLLPYIEGVTPYFLAFTAGSFIYIAVSDLLPELHHHKAKWNDVMHLAAIAIGAASIVLVGVFFHE